MTHPDPTATTAPAPAGPTPQSAPTGTAAADVLVEDVSIDGMCGVY